MIANEEILSKEVSSRQIFTGEITHNDGLIDAIDVDLIAVTLNESFHRIDAICLRTKLRRDVGAFMRRIIRSCCIAVRKARSA